MSPRALVAFATVDTLDAARDLAAALVEERLAACVNILPVVASVYRWEDTIEADPEHLLIIKTSDDRWDTLQARFDDLHPYDVPELIAWPVERGLPAYLSWVIDETRP